MTALTGSRRLWKQVYLIPQPQTERPGSACPADQHGTSLACDGVTEKDPLAMRGLTDCLDHTDAYIVCNPWTVQADARIAVIQGGSQG